MRHSRGRRPAVPMFLVRREPDHIAGSDLLNWTAFTLHPPATGRDNQRLTQRMPVPGRARPRFKGDARATRPGRMGRLEERIDPHQAGEPICGSFARRLRTNSFDFHFLTPSFSTAFEST